MENKKRYSKLQSGLKGALQGASLGFEDELAGLVGSGLDKSQELLNKLGLADKSPSQVDKELGLDNDMYKEFRDAARQQNLEAEQQNPLSYMGGQLTGSALPMLAGGAVASGSNLAKLNALENLAQGVGSSNSSNIAELGLEALENAALNKVGSGALKMLPKNLKNKSNLGKVIMADKGPNKIVYPKGKSIVGQGEVIAKGGDLGKVSVIDDIKQDLGKVTVIDDIKPKNLGKTTVLEEPSELKSDAGKKIMEILGNQRTGKVAEEEAKELIKQQHDRFRHLMK